MLVPTEATDFRTDLIPIRLDNISLTLILDQYLDGSWMDPIKKSTYRKCSSEYTNRPTDPSYGYTGWFQGVLEPLVERNWLRYTRYGLHNRTATWYFSRWLFGHNQARVIYLECFCMCLYDLFLSFFLISFLFIGVSVITSLTFGRNHQHATSAAHLTSRDGLVGKPFRDDRTFGFYCEVNNPNAGCYWHWDTLLGVANMGIVWIHKYIVLYKIQDIQLNIYQGYVSQLHRERVASIIPDIYPKQPCLVSLLNWRKLWTFRRPSPWGIRSSLWQLKVPPYCVFFGGKP